MTAVDGRRRNADRSEWVDTGRKDRNGRPIYALPDAVKLMRGVVKNPETGCWEWQGSHSGEGYGRAKCFGETATHRASWVMHNGPIPPGMFVCHKCDNPPCINPDHLFIGTAADNNADMVAKGRGASPHVRSERSARRRIWPEQREQIRARWLAGNEPQYVIAADFGVVASTVCRVVADLPRPAKPRVCKRGHDWSVIPPYVAHRSDGTTSRTCRECQRQSERRRTRQQQGQS